VRDHIQLTPPSTIQLRPHHNPSSHRYAPDIGLFVALCVLVLACLLRNINAELKKRHGHLTTETQQISEICRTIKTREQAFQYSTLQNAMAQEVLSHRKVIVEHPIEMTNLSASHVGPAKSLEVTAKTCSQDVTEENKDTRTRKQKATERVQFAAVFWCLFLAGWNDGTTGLLLPRIQEVYDVCYPAFSLCPLCYLFCTQVNFTIVFLIFIFACLTGPLLSLGTSTVDHQVTGFHSGSSCQCTPDASVWIGGHRRWSKAI